MKVTIKELIQKLHEFPLDAEIEIDDIEDDQEFFIINFSLGGNILTIEISRIGSLDIEIPG